MAWPAHRCMAGGWQADLSGQGRSSAARGCWRWRCSGLAATLRWPRQSLVHRKQRRAARRRTATGVSTHNVVSAGAAHSTQTHALAQQPCSRGTETPVGVRVPFTPMPWLRTPCTDLHCPLSQTTAWQGGGLGEQCRALTVHGHPPPRPRGTHLPCCRSTHGPCRRHLFSQTGSNAGSWCFSSNSSCADD